MKCTTCDEPAGMVLVREEPDQTLTRLYRCTYGHTTHTREVPAVAVGIRELQAAARAAVRRKALWWRNQEIVASTESAAVLRVRYGVTDARIRQIRDTVVSTKRTTP